MAVEDAGPTKPVPSMAGRHKNSSNKDRYSLIQHDMLAASSRRPADAEMFQALGCEPRGDENPSFK
jgi:hypothetical protein